MATTFNLHQTSIIHSPFLNNHQIHDHFKSNPSFSIKFPLNHKFMQINCNHSKPNTKFLLKPSLKPLITQSTLQNATIHAFGGFGAPFSDSRWRNALDAAVRGDFRAWSRRRPGSSSGGKKNRVSIALECTGCLGNRYTTEKRRVARVDTRKGKSEKKKEDKNGKLGDALVLSKYCPKCRGHFLHKELKIGTS